MNFLSILKNLRVKENFWCKLKGHKWIYEYFTDHVNSKGERYLFSSKCTCIRCRKTEYKYKDWEEQLREEDTDEFMP